MKATPAFTCKGVELADLEDSQCQQYLMPEDDAYNPAKALYCGNPVAEGRRKFCSGHLERLKASNGKGIIGRFTDTFDRGLSRFSANT